METFSQWNRPEIRTQVLEIQARRLVTLSTSPSVRRVAEWLWRWRPPAAPRRRRRRTASAPTSAPWCPRTRSRSRPGSSVWAHEIETGDSRSKNEMIKGYDSTSVVEVQRAHFFSPAQAWALCTEPGRAQACENIPRACLEPELFTDKNGKIRAGVYFEPFWKLGLLSLKPFCLLTASQKFDLHLVPPLATSTVVDSMSCKLMGMGSIFMHLPVSSSLPSYFLLKNLVSLDRLHWK